MGKVNRKGLVLVMVIVAVVIVVVSDGSDCWEW